MIKREKKTCFDCSFTTKLNDENVLSPSRHKDDEYECTNGKVDYSFLEDNKFDYENMAQKCPFFNSIQLDLPCYVCGKDITGDKFDWPFWAIGSLEDIPVCSKECQEELQPRLTAQDKAIANE